MVVGAQDKPCTTGCPDSEGPCMSRRPVMFLSTLAVAAIGLAACSDGDGDAAEPTTSETTVTPEVPTTPAAEPTLPEETAPAGDEPSPPRPGLRPPSAGPPAATGAATRPSPRRASRP